VKIPFLSLQAVNSKHTKELVNAASRVIKSGRYINGAEVKAFEKEFSEYCGTLHCVGVGNGYDALYLIFRALINLKKLSPGDEIVVPHNSFIASALAITNSGLTPVFCDVCPNTHNINASSLSKVISSKTKAVLVVHLYGKIAPMDELHQLLHSKKILIVEDVAQAHGAKLGGKLAGSWGIASAYSFYPAKNLGALGDAGAVTTNNRLIDCTIRKLANYGGIHKYQHEIIGVNSRLDEIQAAFLRIKLRYLNKEIKIRQKIAARYKNEIKNSHITHPEIDLEYEQHVFHLYVIRTPRRDELISYLQKNDVETMIHYPKTIDATDAYKDKVSNSNIVRTNYGNDLLSLPLSSTISNEEVDKIIELMNKFP